MMGGRLRFHHPEANGMRVCLCRLTHVRPLAVVFSAAFILIATRGISGQLQYSSGQEVTPDFSGWEANPDGSFNMVFGYMNQNYEEHLHIPVGRKNKSDRGGIDGVQRTYFLPRRTRLGFSFVVPPASATKDSVWPLPATRRRRAAYPRLK